GPERKPSTDTDPSPHGYGRRPIERCPLCDRRSEVASDRSRQSIDLVFGEVTNGWLEQTAPDRTKVRTPRHRSPTYRCGDPTARGSRSSSRGTFGPNVPAGDLEPVQGRTTLVPPSHPLNDGRSMKLETWLRLFADRGTPHEVPLVPVRELVAGPAVAVDRATSLREAARIMRSRRVSSLLVDHGKAIVTERDITRAIGAGGHPTETVETVATAAPIRVDGSLSVIAAGHVMLDEQVRH